MSAHTPGPWSVKTVARTGWKEVRCPDGRGPTDIIRDPIQREANVDLMAAAPELARACRMLVSSGGLLGANLSNAIDAARAALKKAGV